MGCVHAHVCIHLRACMHACIRTYRDGLLHGADDRFELHLLAAGALEDEDADRHREQRLATRATHIRRAWDARTPVCMYELCVYACARWLGCLLIFLNLACMRFNVSSLEGGRLLVRLLVRSFVLSLARSLATQQPSYEWERAGWRERGSCSTKNTPEVGAAGGKAAFWRA